MAYPVSSASEGKSMRRLMAGIAIACAVSLAFAGIADAKTKAPTAKQLAQKLVKAKLCMTVRVTDPHETIAECIVDTGSTLKVHAFTTKAAMQDSLDADFADVCHLLPTRGTRANYRVGPTWWMAPYASVVSAKIERAIGGTLKTFDCP